MSIDDSFDDEEHVSLCELLDRLLNKGVVVQGDIMISVADIDLVYLGVRLLLASVETARQAGATLPIRFAGDSATGLRPAVHPHLVGTR